MPSRSSSRCTRATRASPSGGRVAVCFPQSTDEVAAAVARRPPPRPAVRRARQRHRARRRRDAARRPGRHRDDADEPRARGRRRGPGRVGRARRAEPRPLPGGRPPRPALRARPVVAAGLHDRRQRRHQRRRAALPRRRRHLGARARGRRRARRRRRVARLGGLEPDQPGYDLRGCFVGSEGTMGIATRIAVRLTPDPPCVATMLCAFDSVEAAAATVSGIIAAGVLPAALEMMDARITRAVEDFVGAGYPRDARGRPARRGRRARQAASANTSTRSPTSRCANGATLVRVAADENERALLWKGRKSAFGAIARIAPDYYLHDAVVPRTKLVDVLAPRLRDRRRARAHRDERLPRGRRQPASASRLRPARARRVGARLRGRDRDPRRVPRRRGSAHRRTRGRHREARPDAADVLARRSRRAGPAARRVRSRRRREPAEGACRGAAGAASCSASRRARGSDRRPRSPVGARTHWEVGGPAPAGRDRGARAGGRHRVRTRRHDRSPSARARASTQLDRVLAEHGQECALDPRSPAATIGGHPRVRPLRACAGSATARCATTCSKCASRPATAAW